MTLVEFLRNLNAKFGPDGYTFSYIPGAKYARVCQQFRNNDNRSAFAFVDGEGNIYKPAGWKGPAKGVRANLATLDMNVVDPYGSWLYRR